MTVAGLLLAAGGGSRFAASGGDGSKLLAPFRGRPVIEWAVDAVTAAGLPATYVVSGAAEPAALGLVNAPVSNVSNPRWRHGLATSLQAGIAAARRDGFTAVVVGLADQPLVTTVAWQRVAAETTTAVAVADYAGRRGHPVRLAAAIWPRLPVAGDVGAGALIRGHPDLVTRVPCPGDPHDVDVLDDLGAAGPTT